MDDRSSAQTPWARKLFAERWPTLACVALLLGCGNPEIARHPTECRLPSRLLHDGSCVEPGVQDDGCPAGTLLTDDACVAAGLPAEACALAQGFEPAGDGCEPVLPPEPCAEGLMAIPGDRECRPVMPCGAGRYGDLPIDATTQHVDAGYSGGDSDGTADRPWTTISQAIAQADPGGLVAVAEGSYSESISITQPVRLWGICPERVEVVSTGNATIHVYAGAAGATIGGIAIRGTGQGVAVDAKEAVLDRIWIQGVSRAVHVVYGSASIVDALVESSASGIQPYRAAISIRRTAIRGVRHWAINGLDASVEVTRSSIERNDGGVFVTGGDLAVSGSVIRDNGNESGEQSWGLGVQGNVGSGVTATLAVEASIVERNVGAGIDLRYLHDVAEIDSTLIRDNSGPGVFVGNLFPASLDIRHSVIAGNGGSGVDTSGAETRIEGAIVRGNQSAGVVMRAAPFHGTPGLLRLSGSLVEENLAPGVVVTGSHASIAGRVLLGGLGRGIQVQDDAELGIRGSLDLQSSVIETHRDISLALFDSAATVIGTRVVGTSKGESGGDGIAIVTTGRPASLFAHGVEVKDSARAAISMFGAELFVESVSLRCQETDILTAGGSVKGTIVACGCPGADRACKLVSSDAPAPERGFE